jgi:threonine dehydrogenase-like Zn-dependent dehydrogenase
VRAVVSTAPSQVSVAEDWPEPDCGPDDVLVAVQGVGLCGSDLAVAEGRRDVPHRPWLLGHEGGGRVLAVGSRVTTRRPGQTVVIEPNYPCLRCEACRSDATSSCERRQILGVNTAGIAAERVAVPARHTWPVPDGTTAETLACVEPWVVTRSALRRVPAVRGLPCLVVGAGSQGLLLAVSLLAAGADPYVVEPHEGRRALAVSLGARDADAGPSRYPLLFETSGAADAYAPMLERAAHGAHVVLIGQPSTPVTMRTQLVVRRQLHLHGSLIYDHPGDFAAAVETLAHRPEQLAAVVRAGFTPDEAHTAFAAARDVPGKSWLDLRPWVAERDAAPDGRPPAGLS